MEIRKAWSFGDDVKSRNSQLQKLLGLCVVNEGVCHVAQTEERPDIVAWNDKACSLSGGTDHSL